MDRYLASAGYLPSDTYLALQVPPTAEEIARAKLTPEAVAKLGGGLPRDEGDHGEHAARRVESVADREIPELRTPPSCPSDSTTRASNSTASILQGRTSQRDRAQRADRPRQQFARRSGRQDLRRAPLPASRPRRQMDDLVGNLAQGDGRSTLQNLQWMTPATRVNAKAKLDTFRVKIGYPNKFKTYDRHGNPRRQPARQFACRGRMAAQQGSRRPAQARRPRQVGNESAGSQCLLQRRPSTRSFSRPPICRRRTSAPTADPAINYGAIGATIGHEIGHGFDDKGSHYDGTGALDNWWTDEDTLDVREAGQDASPRSIRRCARSTTERRASMAS